MNRNKVLNLAFSLIVAVMLISLALLSLGQPGAFAAPPAAPPAAPTPDANVPDRPAGRFVRLYNETAIAADTNTTGFDVIDFDTAAVQYIIDHGTVNTTTITAQFSNDNSNWFNGPAVVSTSAADANGGTFVPLGWRYLRLNLDVATTDTITITAFGVLK